MCCHRLYHEILIPLGLNFIAAILFGVVVFLIQQLRYLFNLRIPFNDVRFEVFRKYGDKRIGEVLCTVKGNRIVYKGSNDTGEVWDKEYEGEFIMNEINLKMGQGFHFHRNYDGFNFPKMVIQSRDTFFIESSFVYVRNQSEKKIFPDDVIQVPQAFVWRRKKS